MVIDLKLCRFESAPWGFRLIGGTDFEVPLTVVKVTEGSLADQAGMQVGDIIVRINDEPTCNMTHNDAHDVISKCGNNFFLGVLREDEQNGNEETCNESEEKEESSVEISGEIQNVSSHFQERSDTSTVEATYKESCETHEERTEEEVIAEVMSGEAEVLKEHNVIGVNFNRIFPKAGICQSSEVFRTLNEEAVKTKIEIEKEKRKWTTFLQKPDRPIPKSKQDIIEEQIKGEPYRVRIVKQVKPDPASGPKPQPETKHEPEPELPPEPEKVEEIEIEEPLAPLTDTEVPNLESDAVKVCSEDAEKTMEENNNEAAEDKEESKSKGDVKKIENEVDVKEDSQTEEVVIQSETITVEKTEEELLLEKQLESVQQQLLALSSLPSTIQATLDAVTKQLTELLPTFKLQPQLQPNRADSPLVEAPKEEASQLQQNEVPIEDIGDIKTDEDIEEIKEILEITSAKPEIPDQIRSPEPVPIEIEEAILDDEQRKMQEELQYKKQKISFKSIYIVPLHHYPELIHQCCDLINSEWERSDFARLRSLEASCDFLPISLILVTENIERVIAHCKLSPIGSKQNCCFMESMVVDKRFRRQGFGRIMVEGAEDYCRTKYQTKAIYLATIGQEIFYEKMGYDYCPPIEEFEPRNKRWSALQNSNRKYMRKFL